MKGRKKYGIITVTTPTFLPGSLVAIHSFLRNNEWFSGDIIVLADHIEPRFERFFHLFPNIRIEQISPEVIERTERVSQRFEQFQRRKAQFYSLDLARFTDYDKLLFFDSDVLFLGDIKEVFERPEPMLCCGDGFYYNDQLRDPASYQEVRPEDLKPGQEVWTDNFNAGFMLFDKKLLRQKHHSRLTEMIDTGLFGSVETNHSDQLILNRHFKQDYSILSGAYNYRLGVSEQIMQKDGVQFEDAKMLHFTSRRKPWENVHVLLTIPKFRDFHKAYLIWLDYWLDFLEGFDNLPEVQEILHDR